MAQRVVMGSAYSGFGREQVGCTDLHGRSAEGKGRNDAACIGDSARSNHRHADRVDDLWQQRHQADLAIEVIAEKQATVPTRFDAHGDDRVAAVLFQPHGFLDGGGR